MANNPRILVIGSEGTLGKPLCKELRTRGHIVYTSDLMHSHSNGHIRADIGEFRQVNRLFHTIMPHVVYLLAAEFGRKNGQEYYEQLWRTNCIGTRNIIEACTALKSHLIFASSSEVYGTIADDGPLYEESTNVQVPRFHNEYALSKWANEKQIEIALANTPLKATVLRFFNAYGPNEQYSDYRSVVCLFIYRMLHDLPITVYKDYHRVFMYVDDWARTTANCVDVLDRIDRQTINIGGKEYCSVEELVNKLSKLIQSNSHINYLSKEEANITNKCPDITKAVHFLQHDPSTTLDQGLPPTVEWMAERYGCYV